ncbi:MAG: hypothetical protein ACMVO3_22860 [Thalassobaculum sp.]
MTWLTEFYYSDYYWLAVACAMVVVNGASLALGIAECHMRGMFDAPILWFQVRRDRCRAFCRRAFCRRG